MTIAQQILLYSVVTYTFGRRLGTSVGQIFIIAGLMGMTVGYAWTLVDIMHWWFQILGIWS